MHNPFDIPFRLTKRGGFGLACDAAGIALGPVVLVELTEERRRHFYRLYRRRPVAEIIHALTLGYGPIEASDLTARLAGLEVATNALNHGDMARASVATVLLKLPPLSREALAKLAGDPTLKKYSPDQPRDERGRWTSGDGDDAAAFAGDGERAGASSASAKPVQVADAGNQMSDAGGILPAPSGDRQSTKIPPPAGTGAVREYSPEEAASSHRRRPAANTSRSMTARYSGRRHSGPSKAARCSCPTTCRWPQTPASARR
jgi:hypothetical protein